MVAPKLLTYAVYRCYYGEDWILASIRSILPYVDKVLVYYTNSPWGDLDSFLYRGMRIPIPAQVDCVVEYAETEGAFCHYWHDNTPYNMFTTIINEHLLKEYEIPNRLIIMEVDHVWKREQIENALTEFNTKGYRWASSRQIEIWRPPHAQRWYRTPERPQRCGVVFWNLDGMDLDEGKSFPSTVTHGNVKGQPLRLLNAECHNFGFAVSWESMWWKHVIGCSMSRVILDSIPNEDWLEKKWLGWRPGVCNLEISRGHESDIPEVKEYPEDELPEAVTAQMAEAAR